MESYPSLAWAFHLFLRTHKRGRTAHSSSRQPRPMERSSCRYRATTAHTGHGADHCQPSYTTSTSGRVAEQIWWMDLLWKTRNEGQTDKEKDNKARQDKSRVWKNSLSILVWIGEGRGRKKKSHAHMCICLFDRITTGSGQGSSANSCWRSCLHDMQTSKATLWNPDLDLFVLLQHFPGSWFALAWATGLVGVCHQTTSVVVFIPTLVRAVKRRIGERVRKGKGDGGQRKLSLWIARWLFLILSTAICCCCCCCWQYCCFLFEKKKAARKERLDAERSKVQECALVLGMVWREKKAGDKKKCTIKTLDSTPWV